MAAVLPSRAARGLDGAVGGREELVATVAVVEVVRKGVTGWCPSNDVAERDVGVVGGHGRHDGHAVILQRARRGRAYEGNEGGCVGGKAWKREDMS